MQHKSPDQAGQREHRHPAPVVQGPGDDPAVTVGLVVEPGVEARQHTADAPLGRFVVARWVAPVRRQHRVQREADEQADQHAGHHRQPERPEPFTAHAGHEGHRDEHGDDRKRGRRHRQPDLGGAVQCGGTAVSAALHVTNDVLAHHDRIVDQHADGQAQAQQAHEVERETAQPHRDEGCNHAGRQRQRGDQGRTPRVQEHVDHEDRQHRAEGQRVDHVAQAVLGVLAAVERDFQNGAGGQRRVDLGHQLAHPVGGAHGAGFAGARDRQADVGVAAAQRNTADLGKSILHHRHLGQPHQLTAAALDHDLLKFSRALDASEQPDALVFKRAAHLAHRRGGVLGAQRGHHFGDADFELTQFFSAQQHAQFAS